MPRICKARRWFPCRSQCSVGCQESFEGAQSTQSTRSTPVALRPKCRSQWHFSYYDPWCFSRFFSFGNIPFRVSCLASPFARAERRNEAVRT